MLDKKWSAYDLLVLDMLSQVLEARFEELYKYNIPFAVQYFTKPNLIWVVGKSLGSKRYAIIIPGRIVASIGSSG